MAGNSTRARSESHDFDDSEPETPNTGEAGSPDNTGASKPGRKKNPNSQAARRDQNRIAQREFRLRKQQRIRDLEARVEILSGGKDDALGQMRLILEDLINENTQLRNLVKNLSAFIGEGIGGSLAKLGWNKADFDNFLNRAPTDTAYDAWQRRKAPGGSGSGNASGPSAVLGNTAPLKRRAEDGGDDNDPSKRARNSGDTGAAYGASNGYSLPGVPLQSSSTAPTGRSPHDNNLYSALMRQTGSQMFIPPAPPQASPPFANAHSPVMANPPGGFGAAPFPSPLQVGIPPLGGAPMHGGQQQTRAQRAAPRVPIEEEEEFDDPKKEEAYKLLGYHMNNFLRNPEYCLPSSLRATDLQKKIPHNAILDGIPIPDLRDHMILLQDKYDAAECLADFRQTVHIHGDDVLSHVNWEIDESWLKKYSFLVDQNILNLTNRWRRERGDHELTLEEIGPSSRHLRA